MDEQNHHQVAPVGKASCACGMGCGCSGHSGHRLLRWVLGIFILFFVFAVGVKVGEFITEIRNLVGSGGYGDGYHMMFRNQEYLGVGAPIPSTTATPPASATQIKP